MKNLVLAALLTTASYAYSSDYRTLDNRPDAPCQCSALTKVCTMNLNGTQQDVYLTVYDARGQRISGGEIAHGVSLDQAIQILNTRACY